MTSESSEKFLSFVARYLIATDANCYRHCNDPTRFKQLFEKDSTLVGAYICPQNYVSRVVYFAKSPDAVWFKSFLSDQVGDRLHDRDIRFATRHGWELGGKAEEEINEISKTQSVKEYYWTFYGRTDEERERGTFLCPEEEGGCGTLFTKLRTDTSRLCPKCS